MPVLTVLLAEAETDLLLFPPLRSNWSLRGQPSRVLISGRNARRVIFGALNLHTGKRLFLASSKQTQQDFQTFLRQIYNHYRGWNIAILLDGNSTHTARKSIQCAESLDIRLLWLPKRSPELNPMDHLWGHAKNVTSANLQFPTIDGHVHHFLEYLNSLSNWDAREISGSAQSYSGSNVYCNKTFVALPSP